MPFSSLEEDWPPTEVSVTKPEEYIPEEMAPIFLPPFFFLFSHFRDLTTVQSAPILRMARTVWKNVQMAYRGQTVSFSSMLIRIGSATHAIQTAPKGKQFTGQKLNHVRIANQEVHTCILSLTQSTEYIIFSCKILFIFI